MGAALSNDYTLNGLSTVYTGFAGALKHLMLPLKLTGFTTRARIILNIATAKTTAVMVDGLP